MWRREEVEFCVTELTKLGTVRGIQLDPRALLIWAEALSAFDFAYIMGGIEFLKTHLPDAYLTVPLIVEAASEAGQTTLGRWWDSEELTLGRGRELGIGALGGESWTSYRARLVAAGEHRKREKAAGKADSCVRVELQDGRLKLAAPTKDEP
jgi:hypothetical protein